MKIDSALQELRARLKQANEKTAREVVEKLKQTSPRGHRKTNKYKDGWDYKENKKGGYTVYNETNYRLTHLLEKGHATRNGRRRTKPQPHLEPIELQLKEMWSKNYGR